MCYHLMMFFWALSEKHRFLKLFELIGDWLEDFGLDHGYIRPNFPDKELIRAALVVYEANISVGYEHPKMEEWAASLRQLDRAAERYLEGEKC